MSSFFAPSAAIERSRYPAIGCCTSIRAARAAAWRTTACGSPAAFRKIPRPTISLPPAHLYLA